MVTVSKIGHFYEDCDSEIEFFCENCDHGRCSIYTSSQHFRSGSLFLKRLMRGHLHLSPLKCTSVIDTWADVVDLKEKIAETSKIIR